MPIDQMQQLTSLQGKVSGFHVRLRPLPSGESPEHYLKRSQALIEAAVPGLNAQSAADRAANNQFVDIAHAVAWGTSCIALLMGILGIANTMAMSVFERTREIGILRAIGWKAWRVLLLIQVEATVLGSVGGILGIGIGWGALHVLATLPQTAGVVSSNLDPLHFVEALAISVLSGLVAGAYPAWRGAHLSPVEALRHD
jgi:putative ABC transport system permease protein